MFTEEIVKRIEAISKERNQPVYEIAEKSGVGRNAIFRWRTKEPKLSTIRKVADYLDVDYKTLLP